jgi:hypothetical protein
LLAGLAGGINAAASSTNLTQLPSGRPAEQRLISDSLGLYETPPRSRCSAAAAALLTALAEGFKTHATLLDVAAASTDATRSKANGTGIDANSSLPAGSKFLFRAQPGYIDFGFAGTPVTASGSGSNDTSSTPASSESDCEPACSYSNPSAAYGVTVLPLGPDEDLQAKVQNPLTPRHEAQNLDGRYGPAYAPSWQLQQDEVVLLAGCTPPAAASRCAIHRGSDFLGCPITVAISLFLFYLDCIRQLQQYKVVLLAGCTLPAEASKCASFGCFHNLTVNSVHSHSGLIRIGSVSHVLQRLVN